MGNIVPLLRSICVALTDSALSVSNK